MSALGVGGSGGFLTTFFRNFNCSQPRVEYLSLAYALCPRTGDGYNTLDQGWTIFRTPGWCKGTTAIADETTTQERFRPFLSLDNCALNS